MRLANAVGKLEAPMRTSCVFLSRTVRDFMTMDTSQQFCNQAQLTKLGNGTPFAKVLEMPRFFDMNKSYDDT